MVNLAVHEHCWPGDVTDAYADMRTRDLGIPHGGDYLYAGSHPPSFTAVRLLGFSVNRILGFSVWANAQPEQWILALPHFAPPLGSFDLMPF